MTQSPMQSHIIILDDEEGQRIGAQVKAILERKKSYQVDLIAGSVRNVLHTVPRLVIPVVPTAKAKAEKLLSELKSLQAQIPVLPVVSPEALSEGFDTRFVSTHDFLVMPLREAEVHLRVRRLTGFQQSAKEGVTEACALAQLIGEEPAFSALKRRIPLVARFESTVLLTGETGTGKERVARALHYSSNRAGRPFLPVNCGAIPEALFENELFGHKKGAFTGAVASQPGLIAESEGGTLFLDEIETLSLANQVKLLRFLQDQAYYPVGSATPKQANVWIVASTNVELPLKIQDGTFRSDLFYRLAVISLALPPLRERKADVPLLASHFWSLYAPKAGRSDRQLSSKVMDVLCQYRWPGNVRELENVIRQIAVLTESQTVRPEDLPIQTAVTGISMGGSFARKKAEAIEQFERVYIADLLRVHQGNVTRAAREAQKDRRAFGRLIKKYRIAKR